MIGNSPATISPGFTIALTKTCHSTRMTWHDNEPHIEDKPLNHQLPRVERPRSLDSGSGDGSGNAVVGALDWVLFRDLSGEGGFLIALIIARTPQPPDVSRFR